MDLRLKDLERGTLTVLHPGRNATKADVHLLELDGRRYAVKDFRRRSFLVRHLLGGATLAREERAYRRLAGLPGIPALAGRPAPMVLVTGYAPAVPLSAWGRERPLPPGFFAALKRLLREVHGRGVVQGDLHHRDVLVGEGGEPWLVDFSTGLLREGLGGPLRRWLWELLARLDRRAVLKLQDRFQPGTLTEEERRELRAAPWPYRAVRRLRGVLRGRR